MNKNQLILEASEDDKWLVTDLPEKDANILNTKFLENKKNSFGYQFISKKTICISLISFLRMRSKHYHITVNLIGKTIYGIFIKVIP